MFGHSDAFLLGFEPQIEENDPKLLSEIEARGHLEISVRKSVRFQAFAYVSLWTIRKMANFDQISQKFCMFGHSGAFLLGFEPQIEENDPTFLSQIQYRGHLEISVLKSVHFEDFCL